MLLELDAEERDELFRLPEVSSSGSGRVRVRGRVRLFRLPEVRLVRGRGRARARLFRLPEVRLNLTPSLTLRPEPVTVI